VVKQVLRTLRMPRWRLALRVLAVVLLVALGLRVGIFWGFLVPVGLLLCWAFAYDVTHKPRGGWRPAPMGTYAVVNHVDPTFLINERGDVAVDPTGRTYGAATRIPTPEEQEAMGGGEWRDLLWVIAEVVVLAIVVVLLVLARH